LKKRSKKLLLLRCHRQRVFASPNAHQTEKSFLVLFFKKEHSSLEDIGRWPRAEIIVFLASPAARAINGVLLPVTG
jgi:hypothetical protein